jgi:hypothetical protein
MDGVEVCPVDCFCEGARPSSFLLTNCYAYQIR